MIVLDAGLVEGADKGAGHALPWEEGRYRPWSLREIMESIGNLIFRVSRKIAEIQGHNLTLLARVITTPLPEADRRSFLEGYAILKDSEFTRMFPSVGAQLERMHQAAIVPTTTAVEFFYAVRDLQNKFEDEINKHMFVYVTDPHYLDADNLSGQIVSDKFAAATEDISEAGKCFALGKFTATVFHLMRVMEIGVQEFGSKIGVSLTSTKVWHVILQEADKAIRAMDQKANETKQYAAISAHLYNVKLAWRNEVMHPKATYTEEEARKLMAAVRSYMEELAIVA